MGAETASGRLAPEWLGRFLKKETGVEEMTGQRLWHTVAVTTSPESHTWLSEGEILSMEI